jgi:lipopolysaccharide export system protein LptA
MKLPILTLLLGSLIVSHAGAQESVKPLTGSELQGKIDGLGTGDPVLKRPLGATDEKAGGEKQVASSKKNKGPTEITASDLDLNNKERTGVFTGSVQVLHPEFNLSCDKLTVFLPKAPAKQAPPAQGAKPPEDGAQENSRKGDKKGGGLEKAVAEASGENWVIIAQDKTEADGSVSRNTGRGKKAVYDSKTGNITLTGRPSVQQKLNTIEATQDSTVIILNREGTMTVKGPSRSILRESSE